MSDHLNLNWNSYEANLGASLKELREGNDFFDVTLACEGEQIQCHKLILSACSPVMLRILRHNLHPHPLIYLKGVKFKHLLSVLDFMYDGQVNVSQDDLMPFMTTAEELKVKGLTKSDKCTSEKVGSTVNEDLNDFEEMVTTFFCPRIDDFTSIKDTINLEEYTFSPLKKSPSSKLSGVTSESTRPNTIYPRNPFSLPSLENILATVGGNHDHHPNQVRFFSDQDTDIAKLDDVNNLEIDQGNSNSNEYIESNKSITEKCKSLISKKLDGYFYCLQCNFKNLKRSALIRHVESHLLVKRRVCDLCNKSFKNRNSLNSHKTIAHKVSKGKETSINNNSKVNCSVISDAAGSSVSSNMTGPSGFEIDRVSDGVARNNNTEYNSDGINEENVVSLDNNKKINVKDPTKDGVKIYEDDGPNEKEVISEICVAKFYGEPEYDSYKKPVGVDLSTSEDMKNILWHEGNS